MSLAYAVESWVFSIIGWAWVSLRVLVSRSIAEEFLSYTNLILSTVNLIGHAATSDFPSHPYFALHISTTLFYAYLLLSGMDGWASDTSSIPRELDVRACPNREPAWMVRRDFFGLSDYHLVPGAVTMAFQVIQILISGATLSVGRLWPGHALGYSCLALLSLTYALRFGGAFQKPCPESAFNFLSAWTVETWVLFLLLSVTLVTWTAFEGVAVTKWTRLAARGSGCFLTLSGGISILLVSDGRGMLTVPLLLYFLVSFSFALTGLWPDPVEPEERRAERKAVKWIVPQTLPRPLVMEDMPRDNLRSKKRL